MTIRELLKQALEALEIEKRTHHTNGIPRTTDEAITAIRAHLSVQENTATPEQEPICWLREEWLQYKQTSDQDPHGFPVFTQPTIPLGMVLVPEEPTQDIELAYYKQIAASGNRNCYPVYKAMLAAAKGEQR